VVKQQFSVPLGNGVIESCGDLFHTQSGVAIVNGLAVSMVSTA
jgi:hypothetical protein